ncbi:MAG: hypothetical protein ACLRVN_02355 [Butyricicoccus sp.]
MELKNTEKQEHSVVALTIEITKAEFEAARTRRSRRRPARTSPFRASARQAPQDDRSCTASVFFEEAFNIIYPDAMEMAVESPASSRSAVQTLTWAPGRAPDHHRQGTG